MVERFGEYILKKLLSVNLKIQAVPELIVGEAVAVVGEVVQFFGKASSPFRIQVARQC